MNHQRKFLRLLAIIFVGFFGNNLWAGQELFIRKPIDVYQEDSEISSVIRHLDKGDRVPLSPKAYGEWRKVLVRVKGELVTGWIPAESLAGQIVDDKKSDRQAEIDKVYHNKVAAGISATFSYLSQSSRTYTDPTGTSVNIDSVNGASTFFGIFVDFPVSRSFVLRGDINLRTTSFDSSFNYANGPSFAFHLTQSFVGFGLTGKFYSELSSTVWLGAGIEGAKANNVSLKFTQAQAVPLDIGTDYPFFVIPHADVGIDIPVAGDIYFLPVLRVGVVVAKPLFLMGEVVADVAYRF